MRPALRPVSAVSANPNPVPKPVQPPAGVSAFSPPFQAQEAKKVSPQIQQQDAKLLASAKKPSLPRMESAIIPRTVECQWYQTISHHAAWRHAMAIQPSYDWAGWWECETGAEGDCLFHCLAAVRNYIAGKPVSTYLHERADFAELITEERLAEFKEQHPECKHMTREQARSYVASPHRFEGTMDVVNWLARWSPRWKGTNFILFTRRTMIGKDVNLPLVFQMWENATGPEHTTWILLHHAFGNHWRVLAYVPRGTNVPRPVISAASREQFPPYLQTLLNLIQ
jgi:hypothetical protein